MKRGEYVVGLVSLRVVNAWFYNTSVDVFVERTILMILMAYAVSGIRAWYRHKPRAAGAQTSSSGFASLK